MSGYTKPAWVYVIAKADAGRLVGPVKIGISNNFGTRLSTIQTSCPFKIEMAYVFELPNREIAGALEKMFHETQAATRLYGEWFDYSPIEAICLLCFGYRVLLKETAGDDDGVIEAALEISGVYWAERKFGLAPPHGLLQ